MAARRQPPTPGCAIKRSEPSGEDINDAFPDDRLSCQTYRVSEGLVLGGNPLAELGAEKVDALAAVNVVAAIGVALTPIGVEGRPGEELLPLPGTLEPDGLRVRDEGKDGERLIGLSDTSTVS